MQPLLADDARPARTDHRQVLPEPEIPCWVGVPALWVPDGADELVPAPGVGVLDLLLPRGHGHPAEVASGHDYVYVGRAQLVHEATSLLDRADAETLVGQQRNRVPGVGQSRDERIPLA